MTVIEKIKRCVSLVWDFQEWYDEEDIEKFCHDELSTYPQHNEIMEYFKHIETLDKENEELKAQIEALANINIKTQNIIGEAKEIIRNGGKAGRQEGSRP